MEFIVHDTISAMARLFERPVAERPDALREILTPLAGMYALTGVPLAASEPGELDAVALHRQQSGFALDADDERYVSALSRLAQVDFAGQIDRLLGQAWRYQVGVTPEIEAADTVHVVVLLGSPDDANLHRSGGAIGFGGIPGYIHLVVWPTEENLDRLAYSAVHELNHNLRYANVAWEPATVIVGEQVVAEGLAEAFVRELHGREALGPLATRLRGTELDAAYAKIVANIDVAGMGNLPPYIYGDTTARLIGAEPVGLPDHAGYAVGLRIVDQYLAASGASVAESTTKPVRDILTGSGAATSA